MPLYRDRRRKWPVTNDRGGLHGKLGHTSSLVTSTTTHRRSWKGPITAGWIAEQRQQSSVTNPGATRRSLSSATDTLMLSRHHLVLIWLCCCCRWVRWMRRMNGSCRRAWTGPCPNPTTRNQNPISLRIRSQPSGSSGAPWGFMALTCRPDRATCRAPGTHPRLLRTVPCRPRKGLMGRIMHKLLAIESSLDSGAFLTGKSSSQGVSVSYLQDQFSGCSCRTRCTSELHISLHRLIYVLYLGTVTAATHQRARAMHGRIGTYFEHLLHSKYVSIGSATRR